MANQVLCTLTHVASQLSFKWLAPPDVSLACADSFKKHFGMHLAATELRPNDWEDIVKWCLSAQLLPWLEVFLAKYSASDFCAAVHRHLLMHRDHGATFLTLADSAYPRQLLTMSDPPLAVSILGDANLLQRPMLSVIGSRKASAHAIRESFALGRLLAEAGLVVVSGGAYGCDITGHQGALAAGVVPVPACCVFAGGLVQFYPRGNQRVFDRLAASRAVFLSERLWWAPSRPWDFPARNRLIAGLSPITAVMQASLRSGALVTARLALDQGREVAVLAHPDGDVRASGSAALINDGAIYFSSAGDFIQLDVFKELFK